MVTHEQNMNDILHIIVAHPAESPLSGEPNPFPSFNSEVMGPSESAGQGNSMGWDAHVQVQPKHSGGCLREGKSM